MPSCYPLPPKAPDCSAEEASAQSATTTAGSIMDFTQIGATVPYEYRGPRQQSSASPEHNMMGVLVPSNAPQPIPPPQPVVYYGRPSYMVPPMPQTSTATTTASKRGCKKPPPIVPYMEPPPSLPHTGFGQFQIEYQGDAVPEDTQQEAVAPSQTRAHIARVAPSEAEGKRAAEAKVGIRKPKDVDATLTPSRPKDDRREDKLVQAVRDAHHLLSRVMTEEGPPKALHESSLPTVPTPIPMRSRRDSIYITLDAGTSLPGSRESSPSSHESHQSIAYSSTPSNPIYYRQEGIVNAAAPQLDAPPRGRGRPKRVETLRSDPVPSTIFTPIPTTKETPLRRSTRERKPPQHFDEMILERGSTRNSSVAATDVTGCDDEVPAKQDLGYTVSSGFARKLGTTRDTRSSPTQANDGEHFIEFGRTASPGKLLPVPQPPWAAVPVTVNDQLQLMAYEWTMFNNDVARRHLGVTEMNERYARFNIAIQNANKAVMWQLATEKKKFDDEAKRVAAEKAKAEVEAKRKRESEAEAQDYIDGGFSEELGEAGPMRCRKARKTIKMSDERLPLASPPTSTGDAGTTDAVGHNDNDDTKMPDSFPLQLRCAEAGTSPSSNPKTQKSKPRRKVHREPYLPRTGMRPRIDPCLDVNGDCAPLRKMRGPWVPGDFKMDRLMKKVRESGMVGEALDEEEEWVVVDGSQDGES